MAVEGTEPASSNRLLGVIQTQTEIARLGSDLGAVMSLVVERAQALTHAVGAVVELVEGEDMVYSATSGLAESHLGLRLRREFSLSGQCIREGCVLRCDDSETDDRVDREACRRIGLRSMIVVPLRHHNDVVGVLKVLAEQPAAFDDEDLRILGLMSDLIAAAMFHAAQYESGELFYRATHDVLTGLPNRALFFERLRNCLVLAHRESRRFGVLMLDMDRLKPINDQLGHRAGDAAIQELARRISAASRASDTVARIGGDEFGVILPRVEDRQDLLAHADRLSRHIEAPFLFEHQQVTLCASVGAAVFPDDGEQLEALLEHADQAMYATKRAKQCIR